MVTGLVAGAMTAYDATQVQKLVGTLGSEVVAATLCYGLWVLLVGCALAVLGGFVVPFAPKPSTRPAGAASPDDKTVTTASTTTIASAMDAPASRGGARSGAAQLRRQPPHELWLADFIYIRTWEGWPTWP